MIDKSRWVDGLEKFVEMCGVEVRDGHLILYKAVHQNYGSWYCFGNGGGAYKPGKEVLVSAPVNVDRYQSCGAGLHALRDVERSLSLWVTSATDNGVSLRLP